LGVLRKQVQDAVDEVTKTFGESMGKMREEMDVKLVDVMPSGGGGYGGSGFGGKLLTFKDMVQEEFSGKADDWKKWKDGVEMYVERLMPGLKVRMDQVRDDEMEVPMETEGSEGTILMQFLRVKCSRSGEAERIVKSLDVKRGLEAGRKMWHWFERRAAER
jgi:hypothetical protein